MLHTQVTSCHDTIVCCTEIARSHAHSTLVCPSFLLSMLALKGNPETGLKPSMQAYLTWHILWHISLPLGTGKIFTPPAVMPARPPPPVPSVDAHLRNTSSLGDKSLVSLRAHDTRGATRAAGHRPFLEQRPDVADSVRVPFFGPTAQEVVIFCGAVCSRRRRPVCDRMAVT